MATKLRPIDAGIFHSRLPAGARVSIVHRITGVFWVALLPVALYLIDFSLRSADHFVRLAQWWQGDLARALALLCLWAFAHHFFAGVRHLLLDLDIGIGRKAARASANAVWIAGLVIVGAVALGWWR